MRFIFTIIQQLIINRMAQSAQDPRLSKSPGVSEGAALLRKRTVALVVDFVPVLFIVAAMGAAMEANGGGFGDHGINIVANMGGGFFWFPAWVVARSLYHVPLEALYGRTLGKLIIGVRVEGEDGEKPGWSAAFVRNVLRAADGICFNLVGWFVARKNPEGRRIGDLLAKTNVVRAELPVPAGVSVIREGLGGDGGGGETPRI